MFALTSQEQDGQEAGKRERSKPKKGLLFIYFLKYNIYFRACFSSIRDEWKYGHQNRNISGWRECRRFSPSTPLFFWSVPLDFNECALVVLSHNVDQSTEAFPLCSSCFTSSTPLEPHNWYRMTSVLLLPSVCNGVQRPRKDHQLAWVIWFVCGNTSLDPGLTMRQNCFANLKKTLMPSSRWESEGPPFWVFFSWSALQSTCQTPLCCQRASSSHLRPPIPVLGTEPAPRESLLEEDC